MERTFKSLDELKNIDFDEFDPNADQKYNDESIENSFKRENPFEGFMVNTIRNGKVFINYRESQKFG